MRPNTNTFDTTVDSRNFNFSILQNTGPVQNAKKYKAPLPPPPPPPEATQRQIDLEKQERPCKVADKANASVFYGVVRICHGATGTLVLCATHSKLRYPLCTGLSFVPFMWLLPATYHCVCLYRQQGDHSLSLICGFVYMGTFPLWLFFNSTQENHEYVDKGVYAWVSSLTATSIIIFYCVHSLMGVFATLSFGATLHLLGLIYGVEASDIETLFHFTIAVALFVAATLPEGFKIL